MGEQHGGAGDIARYPSELQHPARLRDGSSVFIRPIRPDDAERLIELYDRLSRHSAYHRFFTVMRRLPPDWARLLANVDYRHRLALVAEHDTPAGVELVAVGRYEPTGQPDTVEVAFAVQDGWQGKGLGTMLLDEVLSAAEARGYRRFCAYVLADNTRMLDLFRRYTQITRRKHEAGVVELEFTRRPAAAAAAPGRGG
jgi:L-amino acid N-acyltransferase YncA